MNPELFIKERKYLNGVSAKTTGSYKYSFRAFDGELQSKEAIINRMAELQETNSNISINTYLRCVNAYFRWLHTEHNQPLVKTPTLKEEQRILATFPPEAVKRLISYRAKRRNESRAHIIACTIMDCGLRISEALSLTKQALEYDNLIIRVKGNRSFQKLPDFTAKLIFRQL